MPYTLDCKKCNHKNTVRNPKIGNFVNCDACSFTVVIDEIVDRRKRKYSHQEVNQLNNEMKKTLNTLKQINKELLGTPKLKTEKDECPDSFEKKWYNELKGVEDGCVLPFPRKIKKREAYIRIKNNLEVYPDEITRLVSLANKHYRLCNKFYIMIPVFLCRLFISMAMLASPLWIGYLLIAGAFSETVSGWLLLGGAIIHPFAWIGFDLSMNFGVYGAFSRRSEKDPFVKTLFFFGKIVGLNVK